MKKLQITRWFVRLYSLFLCAILFVSLLFLLVFPFHTLSLRQEVWACVIYSLLVTAQIVLTFLVKDSMVHMIAAILMVLLPWLSVFLAAGVVPDWFNLTFSAGALFAYGLKLFIHGKKTNRIGTIILTVISCVLFLIVSSLFYSGTTFKTNIIGQSISPNGELTAQTIEYISNDFPYTVKVMICSKPKLDLGLFLLEREPCAIYSTQSTASIEVTWMSDQEIVVNGVKYVQESETHFRKHSEN